MSSASRDPTRPSDWRLRVGLVGILDGMLLVRRGDLFGTVDHSALDSRTLFEILCSLGERFRYRDLMDALVGVVPEREAFELMHYLKNEAGVIAAPYPDVPRSELLISDAEGGFLSPASFSRLELAVVAGRAEHGEEVTRLLKSILGCLPQTYGTHSDLPAKVDAVIVCMQGLGPEESLDLGKSLTARERPWFPLSDFGDAARAGPFFSVPPRSKVCQQCYVLRARSAGLPLSAPAERVSRHFSTAALLGVYHLLRLMQRPISPNVAAERVFSVSADLEVCRWHVAPVSTCPVCGPGRASVETPHRLRLKRTAPTYADSELRDVTRESARSRYRSYVGPLDVIQSVREVEDSAVDFLPSCAATVSAPCSDGGGFENRSYLGIGFDGAHAELACLARAAERLSLCQDGTEWHAISSAESLREEALAPSRWGRELVPYDGVMLSWTKALSLLDGRQTLVPSRSVLYPYVSARGEEHVPWGSRHWGTGCDLTREGALLWALLELIETDTLARVDRFGLSGRPMDPAVLGADQQVARALKAFRAGGHRVLVRDCSLDFDVPVVAVIISTAGPSPRVSRGTCAHPCGPYAIRHALLEAVRNLNVPSEWMKERLRLGDTSTGIPTSKVADLSQGSVYNDLELVLEQVRHLSSSIVAVDMTRSWAGGRTGVGRGFYCMRVVTPDLLGPLSTSTHPRLTTFDPASHPSFLPPSKGSDRGARLFVDDGPAYDLELVVPKRAVSAPPKSSGDIEVLTLGQGVLAELAHKRFQSLRWRSRLYFYSEGLLQDLDRDRVRPRLVIAALGETPARHLRDWNALAYRRAIPWIGLTQRGDHVECGPLVRGAPEPGCYRCLRLHVYERSPELIRLEKDWERVPDSAGGIFHAGARLAVERLLDDVARFLSGAGPQGLRVYRFGPGEDMEEEPFDAVARCEVCGSFAKQTSEY